jgi:hypothetical protein
LKYNEDIDIIGTWRKNYELQQGEFIALMYTSMDKDLDYFDKKKGWLGLACGENNKVCISKKPDKKNKNKGIYLVVTVKDHKDCIII